MKLDDKRAIHAKLRKAGFEARGLDEAAICWCAHEETDGFLSDDDLYMLASLHGYAAKRAKVLADILCSPEVTRWTRNDHKRGYNLRGFLDYNPSHSELESGRKRDRDRKRFRTESRRNPDGIQAESDGIP